MQLYKILQWYDELNELIERLEKEKSDRITRSQVIKRFIKRISKESIISCFDQDLWAAVVENVTVGVDGKLSFRFKNGGRDSNPKVNNRLFPQNLLQL